MSVTTRKRPLSAYEDEDLEENKVHGEEKEEEEVFVSAPILDRSSTFVAHFHPLSAGSGSQSKSKSLTSSIKSLQAHPAFSSADHRMVAWRRPSGQRTLLGATAGSGAASARNVICTTGSDDDGEKYAGKRLERVLIDLNVEGTVVVARWYGGIMLGPVRFTHIETVAKDAIRKWKSKQLQLDGDGGGGAAGTKRLKVTPDDAGVGREKDAVSDLESAKRDEAERARLARQLVERDNSIVVLRGLLSEKTASAAAVAGGSSTTPDPSQASLTAESKTTHPAIMSNVETPTEVVSPQAKDPATAPAIIATSSQTVQSSPSPAKKINYDEMPLQRLRLLDKARDATIAFILKQLDKADEDEKAKA
jgi:hypothetical protein